MATNSLTTSSAAAVAISLSRGRANALRLWQTQPKQYCAALPTASPASMIEADTPSLWELRRHLGHPAAVAILVLLFDNASSLVNLDKNLTDFQIGELANDIIDEFGYMKVEEIKYLLKRNLRREKIFARLDYNVVMNWVCAYSDERTDAAMRISDKEAAISLAQADQTGATISDGYAKWLAHTRDKADKGDPQAIAIVRKLDLAQKKLDDTDRDKEFRDWWVNVYLKNKMSETP